MKKRLFFLVIVILTLLLLLAVVKRAAAQAPAGAGGPAVHYMNIALTARGAPIPSPTIRVCYEPVTQTAPCLPLAAVYNNKDLAINHQLTQPFTGDALGNYDFYVNQTNGARYDIEVACSIAAGCVPATTSVNRWVTIENGTNIQKNGVLVAAEPTVNFVTTNASPVTITDVPNSNRLNITILPWYQTVIQGSAKPQEPALKLIGSGALGVSCADNAGVSTDCTWSTTSASVPAGINNGDLIVYNVGGTVWDVFSGNTVGTKMLVEDGGGNASWATPSSGTVTSVGLQGDGTVMATSVTNSPITSSGTMQLSVAEAPANKVLAGPPSAASSNVLEFSGWLTCAACSTLNVPLATTVPVGSTIYVAAISGPSAGLVTPTDNHSSSYATVNPAVNTVYDWYAYNVAAGSYTITVGTGAGNSNYIAANVLVITGTTLTNPLDVKNTCTNCAPPTVTTSGTVNSATELVLGFWGVIDSGQAFVWGTDPNGTDDGHYSETTGLSAYYPAGFVENLNTATGLAGTQTIKASCGAGSICTTFGPKRGSIATFKLASATGTQPWTGRYLTRSMLLQVPVNLLTVPGTTSGPNTASGTPAATDLTGLLITAGSPVDLRATVEYNLTGGAVGDTCFLQFYRDGSAIGTPTLGDAPTVAQNATRSFSYIDVPLAGAHTYAVYFWVNGSSTCTLVSTTRVMQALEMK